MGQLKQLFPDAFSEGKIDFDVLKQLLGSEVDDSEERYGLNWHGKRQARQIALTPSRGTLRPCQEESVNWDSTQNLMIEGDNLEVLKLLQKSYSGKVKLIYIDPPYNTGKDFVYPDNFQDNVQNYLELTGQTDGNVKLSTNTETSGRYHTDWLNMMYPRLKLARNLLHKSGVIFLTIDGNEASNLEILLNDVFGEENKIASICWQKKVSPANDAKWFSSDHDTILVYAANKDLWRPNKLPRTGEQLGNYRNPDCDPLGDWNSATYTCNKSKHERPNLYYPIKNPNTKEDIWPKDSAVWRYAKDVTDKYISENRLYWGSDGKAKYPRIKLYLSEMDNVVPRSVWSYADVGHTQQASNEIKSLFDGDQIFDTPKPTKLIQRLIQLSSKHDNDIVLDFFAGSGTTAHSVFLQGCDDSIKRKFILVQLPELLSQENREQRGSLEFCRKLGLKPTISELTKERLRRAGAKVSADNPDWQGDTGFRVFKLDTSNIRPWSADAASLDAQMQASLSPLLEDRSQDDVMTELLLKRGIDLSVRLEVRDFDGLRVTCAGNGMLFTCLESHIPASSIEALASGLTTWHRELGGSADAVCYFIDEAFENNVAKSNLCATLVQQGLNQLHSL